VAIRIAFIFGVGQEWAIDILSFATPFHFAFANSVLASHAREEMCMFPD
jgi:hypothetical protein